MAIDTFPVFGVVSGQVWHADERPIQDSIVLVLSKVALENSRSIRLPVRWVHVLEVAAVVELVEALPRQLIHLLPSPVLERSNGFRFVAKLSKWYCYIRFLRIRYLRALIRPYVAHFLCYCFWIDTD